MQPHTYAVTSREAPSPSGPYSQAVAVGPLVFLAGQRPVDPVTGAVPSDLTAQIEQALNNVREVLRTVGADLSNVVKLTVYLADIADFKCVNQVFRLRFSEPYPARTTVGVQLRDVLVELDAVAVVSDGGWQSSAHPHEALSTPVLGVDIQSAGV